LALSHKPHLKNSFPGISSGAWCAPYERNRNTCSALFSLAPSLIFCGNLAI